MNPARVRVWTTGQYNLTYALEMGKRIKDAGMTLMVDLHYSDNWADPGKQYQPVAWGTTVPELTVNIFNYTRDVVLAFAAAGIPIDVLQTGNEINSGLLWPTGDNSTPEGWANVATYLHAARNGARAANFQGKVMIHLANGWDEPGETWWWSNVLAQGTYTLDDVDMMGFSFYPFYGTTATYANLTYSLHTLANLYAKPIMVAETDYPATSCNGTALSENLPNTPLGQEEWVGGIVAVLNSLPNDLGQGILYWEPGWVGAANLGSTCADNLVFDETGKARTSVKYVSVGQF
ncbi:glycoside hydrolase family 53 protein [Calocera cornea HHB12733]|uniref:Arabinogalactan endo-beta-1,4-galactanase n=1 Tax=Calocera cornea HHB12733 TaxID=1353952 RepID=A0A165FU05_9BASI|nr:glycoside hydrolase family 53 protein [Calocera cornea HHB12733]